MRRLLWLREAADPLDASRTAVAFEPTEVDEDTTELRTAYVAVLMRHREQRGGYAAQTTGCSCGWCPSGRTGEPSFLQQYLGHVADELIEADA